MFVIGLTGGIGSGKSTVAELFAERGIEIVDADLIAREVVLPGTAALGQIASHFGSSILAASGELDRAALRKRVFADTSARLWLEGLLHPLIHDRIVQRIDACQSPYCILASPLLLETSQHQLVNRVLVVDVDETSQLQRTLQRDGSDEATIRGIIAAQMARQDRLRQADDVLDNSGDRSKLDTSVDKLHTRYLELAEELR
jgi:dephospho-CoA kinase